MIENGNNGTGMYMPVAPAYAGGNGGFGGWGGDWGWIILLLLCAGGGWGFGGGFGGGFGNMALGYDFPWLLNGQNQINNNTNNGFRDAMINDGIGGIRSGLGDLSTQLYTSQISDLERSFAAQTAGMQGMNALQAQLAQCCCDNRLATNDLKATIASEACNTRAANTANTQAVLDKLCQIELDGYKREADNLRSELQYARGQASQVEQTARILAGQAAEIDGVYNRLKNCPVGTYSVCNPLTPAGAGSCGCGGSLLG